MAERPAPTPTTTGIAAVLPEDYDELASFMSEFPGVKARSVTAWLGRLRTWWDLNPAFDPAVPRGWLLRDHGRIVGFFGSIPLRMQLAGAEATAYAATSWRVLPEYRGKSIGLKMRQLAAHKEQLNFSTTPLEELVPLLKRLGYQQIDRGAGTDQQSQFILDFDKFWRGRFRDRFLVQSTASLAAPILSAVQSFRLRGVAATATGDVRELTRADAAFDELWHRTRRRWANTNVRTAEMVNWYCFSMQPSDRRLLGCYAGDKLLGFMVLVVKADTARRLAECVDVWIDPTADEGRILAGLVAKAMECARREVLERVLFPHFDTRLAGFYRALGLLEGPAWKKREYIKAPPDLLQAITAETSYLVRAQGDYGL